LKGAGSGVPMPSSSWRKGRVRACRVATREAESAAAAAAVRDCLS